MKDIKQQIEKKSESEMIISMLSHTYSFNKMQTRIDEINNNQITMRHQIDKVSTNQEVMQKQMDNFQEQVRDMKIDMDRRFTETRVDMLDRFAQVDKRFEQVDKRFEQVDIQLKTIVQKIDKIAENLDYRDDRQRRFTLRMFSIAVSISSFSVVGVVLKMMNLI